MWTEKSLNDRYTDFVVLEEEITLVDPEGATETNARTSTIPHDLSDRKFLCQIEVTETSAGNGNADARLHGSLDESEWVEVDSSLGTTIDTTGLNTEAGFFDTSKFEAPFWSIQVFTDGTDPLDDATVKVTIAFFG